FDNTLLVQANPHEWEQISSLLRQLDIAPRQVLIDAKIYQLDLTGAFESGVQAYLEKRNTSNTTTSPARRVLTAPSHGGAALAVMARVNSSGVVALVIDQDVSAPISSSSGSIGSPSFSRRSFNTQVTVQDGDTSAIGGFIQESSGTDSVGVPVLHRIPIIGG